MVLLPKSFLWETQSEPQGIFQWSICLKMQSQFGTEWLYRPNKWTWWNHQIPFGFPRRIFSDTSHGSGAYTTIAAEGIYTNQDLSQRSPSQWSISNASEDNGIPKHQRMLGTWWSRNGKWYGNKCQTTWCKGHFAGNRDDQCRSRCLVWQALIEISSQLFGLVLMTVGLWV